MTQNDYFTGAFVLKNRVKGNDRSLLADTILIVSVFFVVALAFQWHIWFECGKMLEEVSHIVVSLHSHLLGPFSGLKCRQVSGDLANMNE